MHCLYSVFLMFRYVSLSHLQIRSIVTNVAKAMKEKGMNVVGELENVCLSVSHPKILTGFVANGEFNSLQSMGNSRPLSVLKLKSNARAKYAQMGKAKMMRMLSPTCEYICYIPYSAKFSRNLYFVEWPLKAFRCTMFAE